ncbi:hypothetical protein MC7420_8209 [Coleofasciculus chthonoplastes PCC 7420]|uniref:Uncharacterized protein n=1 Tax=Coleofasciculus chthonoplastes PCC 7420 TaxID=118168 RepID=B4W4D3_9CYAN|nr:hypothetical protein MC7420_8209 [Coleofasciculus chthonoplastes PCC 7420]
MRELTYIDSPLSKCGVGALLIPGGGNPIKLRVGAGCTIFTFN